MADIVDFPIKDKWNFGTVQEAKMSLHSYYDMGEAKSCSILFANDFVVVRTPRGMGKFSLKEWNNDNIRIG